MPSSNCKYTSRHQANTSQMTYEQHEGGSTEPRSELAPSLPSRVTVGVGRHLIFEPHSPSLCHRKRRACLGGLAQKIDRSIDSMSNAYPGPGSALEAGDATENQPGQAAALPSVTLKEMTQGSHSAQCPPWCDRGMLGPCD